MPSAWSSKDERQYEHIKESARKRGRSPRRAVEIAARTVNKQRKSEGRTNDERRDRSVRRGGRDQQPRARRAGRGSTRAHRAVGRTGARGASLEDRPVTELRSMATRLAIAGRSRMRKHQLVAAIRGARS
jgi:hypothetical protein